MRAAYHEKEVQFNPIKDNQRPTATRDEYLLLFWWLNGSAERLRLRLFSIQKTRNYSLARYPVVEKAIVIAYLRDNSGSRKVRSGDLNFVKMRSRVLRSNWRLRNIVHETSYDDFIMSSVRTIDIKICKTVEALKSWITSIFVRVWATSPANWHVTMRRMFTRRVARLLCGSQKRAGTLCENGKGQFQPFFGLGPVRTARSTGLAMHRGVKPVTWTKWVFVQQISHKGPQKGPRARFGKAVGERVRQNGSCVIRGYIYRSREIGRRKCSHRDVRRQKIMRPVFLSGKYDIQRLALSFFFTWNKSIFQDTLTIIFTIIIEIILFP